MERPIPESPQQLLPCAGRVLLLTPPTRLPDKFGPGSKMSGPFKRRMIGLEASDELFAEGLIPAQLLK